MTPVPAPDADPGDTPVVCVQFNSAWLPYILGSLFQLTQPTAWDPASPGYADVLAQAQSLMAIFSGAEDCTYMLTWNFTDTCILQYSVDGGATWIDVPGWAEFAPTCFAGPVGPVGPAFVGQGDAPPNPSGGDAATQACNIAAYLAIEIVEVSLNQFISGINDAKSTADTLIGLIGLLTGFDPITDLILGAGIIAINYIAAQGTGPYETALADPAFLSSVQCAIYTAISADGYVTAANYPDVLTNLAAISYVDGDVVTTVHDYVAGLGLTGLQMMQVSGSLYVGDCSGCGLADFAAQSTGSGTGIAPMASDVDFGSGDFTLGGWIHPTEPGGSNTTLWDSGLGPPYTDYLTIYLTTSVGLFVQAVSTGTGYALSNGGVSLNNANHHIVLKRVGSTAYLYVDGALVDSQPFGSGSINQVGGGSRSGTTAATPTTAICGCGRPTWAWPSRTRRSPPGPRTARTRRPARLHEFLADG